jgi:hypothetical protein
MRAQQSGTAAEGNDVVNIADRASGPDQRPVADPGAAPYSPLGGSSVHEADPAPRVVRAVGDPLSTVSVRGGIAVEH